MNFLIEIDPAEHPDAVGEYLRKEFFAGPERQKGCYETFDWQGDVHPLPDLPLAQHNHDPGAKADDVCDGCTFEGLHWTRGEKSFPTDEDKLRILPNWREAKSDQDIECRWWWDGDGTLAFRLPDGRWLLNDDCKCSYDWKVVGPEKELML